MTRQYAFVVGSLLTIVLRLTIPASCAHAQPVQREDIVIADFETDTYGAWKVEGEAFGAGPVEGTLPGQMHVAGFQGKRLVNSFFQGDGTTGKLTSPEFKIDRMWINFLIGGGGHIGKTCMNLIVEGKVIRTEAGSNNNPGGSEELQPASWDVTEFKGMTAVLEIVDQHKAGWGHINVDHITQSDKNSASLMVAMTTTLKVKVDGTHLIVPVSNTGKVFLFGIKEGDKLIQNFNLALPQADEPFWHAAYPLEHFGLTGKVITIAPTDRAKMPEAYRSAFERIRIGTASDALAPNDYQQPYRDQFHITTRRGWNNDPNGMVFHNGKYHLYYQHNPFGIGWGNMHWGHFESTDLLHWVEQPIALYQKTVNDMAFSGGGFVDVNNSAGVGKATLFVAFTSTGRGECLAYSKDDGLSFTELEENPVVKHQGRDPKVLWYKPQQKWVMAVYDETNCAETAAIPPAHDQAHANRNIAFYESKNLRQWTRTGAFTDEDRDAVFECPEMFELPVTGKHNVTRWIVLAAQNRYFIGQFDGQTFRKESGPHGTTHGAFYAAQTFSDVPDGRRIQIGWVRTDSYVKQFPDQVYNQAFTLPHEMTLRETADGLRVFYSPVKETESLRSEVLAEGIDLTPAQANELLQKCQGELSEVLIEFAEAGSKPLVINGMDAGFSGRSARIFTDRTFNEIYADDGVSYEIRNRSVPKFDSTETNLTAAEGTRIRALKVFRLRSIWNKN